MMMRKVALQLVKEFSVPFAGALAWAFFGRAGQPLTLLSFLTGFSTAFFFLSWLGGQLFRVNKQVKTESSLAGLALRLDGVVKGLETSAEVVAGWASGGDSFAHLGAVMNGAENASSLPIIVMATGDYPVYGVHIRIVDVSLVPPAPAPILQVLHRAEQSLNLTELVANSGIMPGHTFYLGEPDAESDRRFNVFFTARNGFWSQQICFRHDGDQWKFATIVRRTNADGTQEVIFRRTYDGFPNPETLGWGNESGG